MTSGASDVDGRQLQAQIDQHWDFDDPATSEQRFRAAAGGEGGAVVRDALLTQVARALGLQQRYADATKLLESLGGATDPEVITRVRLERGRVLNSSGDAAAARAEFETALAAAV